MCKPKVTFAEYIFLASQVFSLSFCSLISIVSIKNFSLILTFVSLYIIHHFSSAYFQCFVFNVQPFEFDVLKCFLFFSPLLFMFFFWASVPFMLDYLIFFTDFWCSILFILHFHAFLKMYFSLNNFYLLIFIFIDYFLDYVKTTNESFEVILYDYYH